MKTIRFVTGNDEKMRDARMALAHFSIEVEKTPLDIDEIQHHDSHEIALAKARAAFDELQAPLMINDSSWSIPALGGFPGGYMKDVTAWLSTDDFLVLMQDKTDKRILLTEVVVYIDADRIKVFDTIREGVFVDVAAGESKPAFARVVKMEGDDVTISQIFDQPGERSLDPSRYEHWNKFGEWYANISL